MTTEIDKIMEDKGFPYVCDTASQLLTMIRTAGVARAVAVQVEDGDSASGRIYVGYYNAHEAQDNANRAMRLRWVNVVVAEVM